MPPDLQSIFASLPGLYLVVAADRPRYTMVAASDAYLHATGITREGSVGRAIAEVFPHDPGDTTTSGNPPILESYGRVIDTRRPDAMPTVRYDIRQAGGRVEERYWDPVNTPVFGADGTVAYIVHQAVDVTEKVLLSRSGEERAKAAERVLAEVTNLRSANVALSDAGRRLRLLTDNIPALVSYVDSAGRFRFVNQTYCEWYGRPAEEFVGRHVEEFVGKEAYDQRRPYVAEALAGRRARFEAHTPHRDGTIRQTDVSYVPDFGEDGVVRGFYVFAHDITARVRAERELRDAQGRHKAVFEAVRDAMIVYTPEGVVVEVNPAASRMYGFEAERVLGTNARDWIPPESVPLFDEFLRMTGTGAEFRCDAVDLRADGTKFPIEVVGTSVTFDGRPYRMAVIRDITDRVRLYEAERSARAEAERASEAKSEFLATLSHELRTPLTPVLLSVSLIESHPELPEALREDVESIRRNVELESRLISDLLDLTRIAKGKLQLDPQPVDAHLLVRAAIDICQRDAAARLVVRLEAGEHVVNGDPTRLQQIFWNLITNAQKFTPAEGTITVRTYNAAGTSGGLPALVIEVSDTGAGIDPGVLPRLFSAFEQGDVRNTRQHAGLGLGLAISRQLAEAHGGTISASSAGVGMGATFTVTLPTVIMPHVGPVAAAPVVSPLPAEDAARSLAILLVEDHEPTSRILTRLLTRQGHRVTAVGTVAGATTAAARQEFDALVCDIGLPDGSGLDVIRWLRDRFAGRAIALTGYGMDSDVVASRQAGFSQHLTKPVDLERLRAALAELATPDARRS